MNEQKDDKRDHPSRLRVLVADDEAIARRRLLRLLAAMPDIDVVGECSDAHDVLTRVRAGNVDVVLLDIQMPELTGMEALQLFPQLGPAVIFCTAHADHAVSAFDHGAVDYLLKPIEGGRLWKALERARMRVSSTRTSPSIATPSLSVESPVAPSEKATADPLQRLALPTRQGIVLLDPTHVTHAELSNELVSVHTATASYLSTLSLQDLEGRLPAESFARVHRRALVNLAHVVRLQPNEVGGFLAETTGGRTVEVSRQAARDLRRRLGLR